MKNISILGCGWLGLPLAKALLEEGYSVKGSTTTRDKMGELTSEGIIPYKLKVFVEGVEGDIASFLSETAVLIIDIPPGLRKNPDENYTGKISLLKAHIEKAGVKKLLFISSTSVYQDAENFPEYSEKDLPNAEANSGKQLISAEKIIKNAAQKTTILRFGGLIGPGRHPVQYLSGRKNSSNSKAPVNLIHLEDCIGIIKKIVETDFKGDLINAVFPKHPEKEDYYSKIAEIRKLAIPQFDYSSPSKGKVISSEVLEKELKYEFIMDIWGCDAVM